MCECVYFHYFITFLKTTIMCDLCDLYKGSTLDTVFLMTTFFSFLSYTDTPTKHPIRIISEAIEFFLVHLHDSIDLDWSVLLAQGNAHFVVFRQQEPFTEVTSLKLVSLSHTFGIDDAFTGTCLFSAFLRFWSCTCWDSVSYSALLECVLFDMEFLDE